LAAYDFVARKKGRREFLLNYLNGQENQVHASSSDDETGYCVKRPTKEQILG
jgi:hypothetical protein